MDKGVDFARSRPRRVLQQFTCCHTPPFYTVAADIAGPQNRGGARFWAPVAALAGDFGLESDAPIVLLTSPAEEDFLQTLAKISNRMF
jgi:hypothetical protein